MQIECRALVGILQRVLIRCSDVVREIRLERLIGEHTLRLVTSKADGGKLFG